MTDEVERRRQIASDVERFIRGAEDVESVSAWVNGDGIAVDVELE